MTKRGYKLQEFQAHSGNVNCLKIGRKACRLLLTGGDDRKVNLWSIGKPTSLVSLRGHTTPVESLAFDPAEVLVLGGAASGTIKLWDLEEAKVVRTLTGHRSNCTSVEFHPFGEFFASGSADTNLKIWDLRKRGCIFTHKGHDLGINTIKFSPDGRWVVSGGFDSVVKVWDLTAGKLLHDLKFHNGHIRSMDFHPLELLLATGSADKTVKFWDLETFEMIGSTKTEAMGVRAVTFHPDGRTLFSGYDNSLKVYSWEPVTCHDAIDMGWSTLGDLCINEAKLVGCSYYRNFVGVWVADLSRVEPLPTGNSCTPQDFITADLKLDTEDRQSVAKVGLAAKLSSGSRSSSPDNDDKSIKNIYVDYEKPVSSQRTGFLNRSNSLSSSSSDTNDTSKLSVGKQSAPITTHGKFNDPAGGRSFFLTNVVPRENCSGKSSVKLRRESFIPAMPGDAGSMKAADVISRPINRFDVNVGDPKYLERFVPKHGIKELVEDKYPTVERVEDRPQEMLSPLVPSNLQNGNGPLDRFEVHSVKLENGVAVANGRTRSLVAKFERRGHFSSSEDTITSAIPEVIADRVKRSTMKEDPQVSGRESTLVTDVNIIEDLMQDHDVLLSGLRSRLTELRMVRHIWERNDIKGAINAVRKLSDPSVQADVIGVLMGKIEIVTMDLFTSMLPILVGLLDSKIERHAKMSLEMLVKLVALFGSTIHSTISATPPVGLDLHREERIECCKQCFNQLHQIQGFLPAVGRRSGSLAKSALELRLVLQDHNM